MNLPLYYSGTWPTEGIWVAYHYKGTQDYLDAIWFHDNTIPRYSQNKMELMYVGSVANDVTCPGGHGEFRWITTTMGAEAGAPTDKIIAADSGVPATSGLSRDAGGVVTVTATTTLGSSFVIGNRVTITGATPASFNDVQPITWKSGTQLTFNQGGAVETGGGGWAESATNQGGMNAYPSPSTTPFWGSYGSPTIAVNDLNWHEIKFHLDWLDTTHIYMQFWLDGVKWPHSGATGAWDAWTAGNGTFCGPSPYTGDAGSDRTDRAFTINFGLAYTEAMNPDVVAGGGVTLYLDDFWVATYDMDSSPPTVGLSSTTIAFPSTVVGNSSSPVAVTMTNNGGTTLTISSIAITGTNPGDFSQSNDCGGSLAAGAHCTIDSTFTPTTTGSRVAAVTITDSAADSPQTISLSGTGQLPAASGVGLAPSSLIFDPLTVGLTSGTQKIVLTNTGTATLNITSIVASGEFARSTTCGATLAPAASCAVDVTFSPTWRGEHSGAITLTDDAADSPQVVMLTGRGYANVPPLLGSVSLRGGAKIE
jgi:archaellum component FlaF (FlaF/FlaG flagellin family)